jgi:hypothetical protein
VLFEILPDPRAFAPPSPDGAVQVLQFHLAIPARVPVGHFEAGGREVVDEIADRTDYLDRVQQACAACGPHWRFGSTTTSRGLSIDGLASVQHPEAVGRERSRRARNVHRRNSFTIRTKSSGFSSLG